MAWQLVYEKMTNQSYRGAAEQCDYTFTVNLPDQFNAQARAHESMEAHIIELQKQGSIILEYRLYEDTSPTFTTDYYVKIIASASPIIWAIIIVGILLLLGLIALWTIREIKEIAKYLGGKAISDIVTALAIISVATVVGIYLVRRPKLN